MKAHTLEVFPIFVKYIHTSIPTKALTNKKGQMFVGMLVFGILFLNLNQLPAAKKGIKKMSIPTNVWHFLFCRGFSKDYLKVNRSQNKIVEPKLLPKNEPTNLFFYPDGQLWAENNLT